MRSQASALVRKLMSVPPMDLAGVADEHRDDRLAVELHVDPRSGRRDPQDGDDGELRRLRDLLEYQQHRTSGADTAGHAILPLKISGPSGYVVMQYPRLQK
jgi:hypothetical protein